MILHKIVELFSTRFLSSSKAELFSIMTRKLMEAPTAVLLVQFYFMHTLRTSDTECTARALHMFLNMTVTKPKFLLVLLSLLLHSSCHLAAYFHDTSLHWVFRSVLKFWVGDCSCKSADRSTKSQFSVLSISVLYCRKFLVPYSTLPALTSSFWTLLALRPLLFSSLWTQVRPTLLCLDFDFSGTIKVLLGKMLWW